jgi:tetratricopeptide (TPR) repeat protein
MSLPHTSPSSSSHREPAEIPFDQFDRMDGPRRTSGRSMGNAVRLTLVVLILVGSVVGLYAVVCLYKAPADAVYLVNGTDSEYSITLGRKTYALRGDGYLRVKLNPGVHALSITNGPFAGESMDITIDRPFWTRPMHDEIYVINPDRTAIIMWEKIPYYDQSNTSSQYDWTYEYHVGQLMYAFDDIDFAFRPEPTQIEDSSASRVVYRERVSAVTDQEGIGLVMTAYEALEQEEALAWFERLLEVDPTQYEVLSAYIVGLDVDAAQAFLEPMLASRPVNLAAHLAFFELCERTQAPTDLVAMYRDLIQHEPQEPVFLYMLALAEPDYDTALDLMKRCVAMPEAPLEAFLWLLYDAMYDLNYADVETYATAALKRDPQQTAALGMRSRAFHATGRYDAAIEDYERLFREQLLDSDTANVWCLYRMLSAHLATQSPAEALRAVNAFAREHLQRAGWPLSYVDEVVADVEAVAAYLQGDFKGCTTRLVRGHSAYSREFLWALMQDDREMAMRYLKFNDYADEHDALTMLLAGVLADDDTTIAGAEASLDDWFEAVSPGVDDLRRGIAGDQTVTIDEMTDDALLPYAKCIAITIVGIRNEALREECFRLAKEMNYDGLFPAHLIDQAIRRYK